MEPWTSTILVGLGATLALDAWTVVRRRVFAVPLPDYRLVGRWLAHMAGGRFRHAAIARSAPMRGESVLGWVAHYLIGIAFAILLPVLLGPGWFCRPSLAPALLVGIATVAAPLFLMQPAMGAGFAGSRSPRPWASRLQSLVSHAVFGLGLYATAWAIRPLCDGA
ncbi:DUF2938 domain-containing protein [Arenimonas donghaensis]|uniref:DUF2938 domain-containing protein n=1 Tax=Arenimonas donghaensis DSM 18148 = HO3-R19 TaxID=1121014 RepID=A0A087MHE7_9GAMM|nr:DUF2938 domain-containing protein [Arenimonas donghaensis]KFL36300.1 hypothetical protein N788_05255 [Arenimonas donghaensis DSM 18148 = HO3-R19]